MGIEECWIHNTRKNEVDKPAEGKSIQLLVIWILSSFGAAGHICRIVADGQGRIEDCGLRTVHLLLTTPHTAVEHGAVQVICLCSAVRRDRTCRGRCKSQHKEEFWMAFGKGMIISWNTRNVLFLSLSTHSSIFFNEVKNAQTRQIIALLYIAFRHVDSVIAGQLPLVEHESRSAAGVYYCIAAVALKMGKLWWMHATNNKLNPFPFTHHSPHNIDVTKDLAMIIYNKTPLIPSHLHLQWYRFPTSHLRFSTNLNNGSAVGGMPVDAIISDAAEVLEQICCIVSGHRRRQGNWDRYAGKFRVAVGCVRSQNATAQRRREHFCNFRVVTRINETVFRVSRKQIIRL